VGTKKLTRDPLLKKFNQSVMYTVTIKNTSWLFSLALILLVNACGKMDDIEKKFTRDGEITYLSRADSLHAYGGNGRIELSWILFSDPKITSCKVFWNDDRDSIVRNISRTPGVDTIQLMLTNMAEGTYYFEVYTYDAQGNASIKSSVIGKVYGPKFAASVLPRSYRKLDRVGDTLQVEWMDGGDQFAGGSLSYTDASGKLVQMKLSAHPDTSKLAGFPNGGSFDYISAFLPEPGAIDTFYKEASIRVPVDTVFWNQYVSVFGHLGSILAEDASGNIFWYGTDGNDGFLKTRPGKLDYPWYIFDQVLSYQNNLIGREIGTGFLYRYEVDEHGVLAPAHWRIGPAGWEVFDLLFSTDDYLYGRKTDGTLWRYPLLPAGDMGAGVQVSGVYDQYDQMLATEGFLFCRDHNGTLWRIPVADDGTTGVAENVAQSWGQYTTLSTLGNDILAKDGQGLLWRIPVKADGKLAERIPVIITYENF